MNNSPQTLEWERRQELGLWIYQSVILVIGLKKVHRAPTGGAILSVFFMQVVSVILYFLTSGFQ